MKGFDVLKVKSAVKTHSKFDLSRSHLTTMNFGEIVPLFVEETVPGDKISVSGEYFSRMLPLVKPTYGKFQFKTVSAFVPYHQIAFDSDAWLGGKTSFEGTTPVQRYITVFDLHNFLVSYGLTTFSGANSGNTDYTYVKSDGSVVYTLFTKTGKYWVKVLNSLGYALPSNVDLQTSSVWYTSGEGDVKLSAYPLLAFFKLYNDYMSQSQRFNTSQLSTALQAVKYGKTYVGSGYYVPASGWVKAPLLKILFDSLLLNYENDYFTSAWMTPNAAAGISEGVTQMKVPSSTRSDMIYWDTDNDGLSINVNTGSPSTVHISQRALDFLKSFDDWVRRNNYSGSRAVQQIYSRFGIKTDDYKSHYANVLSTDSMPIQVGDVTATAGSNFTLGGETKTVTVGDYAGKGIMSGNKSIDCTVSDYGILFILGYFTVVPMNAYGYDRRVLRNTPLDYYNPEFDGLGADAISLGEIYANPLAAANSGDTTFDTGIFGFTERYNAYRYGRDVITGAFRNYHNDSAWNAWHTGRNLGEVRAAGNLVAQSSSVNTLEQTNSQYNRIFSVIDGSEDAFYLTCRFNVDAIRPMLNLNQVVNLGEGDTVVPRNGNVIS